MPPEDAKHQPDEAQRASIISWLGKELEKARSSPRGRHLLGQFSFGNQVDHDALFSGKIKKLPFSPPRLWRMNPNIYDRTKKRIFKDHWMELRRARQPFSLEQRPGINDYSEDLFADSATLETLLLNARGIVEHQLTRDIPQIFRTILESAQAPTREQAEAAVQFQFETLVLRPPKTRELTRYRDYFLRSIKESGGDIRASLEICLKAIALNPEAIYRMELGLGDKDDHGRTILSDNELAFAISFALTDDPPDKTLWSAARSGSLDTPKKIRTQLERILEDPVIAKPKLLRFFREFFGYHRAPQVFKDAKRFKNYDWGIVANQLVHEADLLVLHTLKQDRDVLRQLITTEKYFVGHIGLEADPKNLEQRLIALRRLYDYWKEKPWKKLEYELEAGVRTRD